MLTNEFGVDLDRVHWVTFEDAHVAGVPDPPGAQRADTDKTLIGMLTAGELDAAIVGAPVVHPDVVPLFTDPDTAAADWHKSHNAIQLNHLVVAKDETLQAHPDAVREVYRQLSASKAAAGLPKHGEIDLNPFGLEANRRNLQLAIECVHAQGLIDRCYAVDELFDGVTAAL